MEDILGHITYQKKEIQKRRYTRSHNTLVGLSAPALKSCSNEF